MKRKLFLIISSLLLLFNFAFAQSESIKNVDPFIADQKLSKNNYEAALEDYLYLLEGDAKNKKYQYNIAVCYLNTNINKTKAIPYLEAVAHKPIYDPNALYLLGRAYSYAYRFDDAIATYKEFKTLGEGTLHNKQDVDRQIQFCMNAKELIKFPVNVSFENLGSNVNSVYPDYYAYVPTDESFVIFNSRRPQDNEERIKEDGTFPASIYVSKVVDGNFTKSKSIGLPIAKTEGEQEIIGLTGEGDVMLVYYTNEKKIGDIYIANKNSAKEFLPAEKLGDNINSAKAQEIAASINNDGSIIYFASNREGGIGGTDIYSSQKLPNGKWGLPQNLGPEINTIYDEDFPNITADGKTLYFSSNGYTSMGGYDIFKAELNSETKRFSNPKNIGYPINTPEDNFNFRISNNGQIGYMSALRDGGQGDLDIYRIVFNDIEPRYSVVKGNLKSSDSLKKLNYSDVFISIIDSKTKQLIGNYAPNTISGRYIIILVPGKYTMSIEAGGFNTYESQITILDKNSFEFEITKDIELKPLK